MEKSAVQMQLLQKLSPTKQHSVDYMCMGVRYHTNGDVTLTTDKLT